METGIETRSSWQSAREPLDQQVLLHWNRSAEPEPRLPAPAGFDTGRRVDTVVGALSHFGRKSESLAEAAHDARNMVTALALYCDLLEEPGVLTESYHHYAGELRLVATACRRLVERLMTLDERGSRDLALRGEQIAPAPFAATEPARAPGPASHPQPGSGLGDSAPGMVAGDEQTHRAATATPHSAWEMLPAEPVRSLARELAANRNLLAALAGPAIELQMDCCGADLPVRMTGEDLTRVMVNLVKNAAEAMPLGGRIRIHLTEVGDSTASPRLLRLAVEDNGPGIARRAFDRIFESGYTTRIAGGSSRAHPHRGLGLSITRAIVEAAGGSVRATNLPTTGACFTLELPAGH